MRGFILMTAFFSSTNRKSKAQGEHQSRRPSRQLTFMLNVADDHKSSGANVPFPLISDPIQGLADPRRTPKGEWGGGINKRDNVTAALRCHDGRRPGAAMIKAVNRSHKLAPALGSDDESPLPGTQRPASRPPVPADLPPRPPLTPA